jgi:hypothetical protein
LLLIVCGVALLQGSREWAAALLIAPALMLAVVLATEAGSILSESSSPDSPRQLLMGFWALVAGAVGCVVAVIMASIWLMKGPWRARGAQPAMVPAIVVAYVGTALALAGALTTRATLPDGNADGSLLSKVYLQGGWGWGRSLGVLAVIVAAPIAAIWLGRARRTAPLAFGIAAAVLLWNRAILSILILGGGPGAFRARAGFWFLLASSATFVALGCVLRRDFSADDRVVNAIAGVEATPIQV